MKLSADSKSIPAAYQFLQKSGHLVGLDKSSVFDIRLAVEEALTNIIEYGHQDQGGEIELEVSREGRVVVIHIRDKGIPFDPTKAPKPDFSLPLGQRKSGGVGIFLMIQAMDVVEYTSGPEGNQLTLKKNV